MGQDDRQVQQATDQLRRSTSKIFFIFKGYFSLNINKKHVWLVAADMTFNHEIMHAIHKWCPTHQLADFENI